MQVRRFTAPTMAQAVRQVKQALGPRAVILSTLRLEGGGVEISAAVERADSSGAGLSRGSALHDLSDQVRGLGRMLSRHLMDSEAGNGFSQRPEVAPLYRHLKQQEVAPEVIARLLEGLAAPQGHGLTPRLAIRLKKMLNVSQPPRLGREGPVAWALVGPTGVGKTTTLAKLAATFSLRYRLRVGLVTVDTFRIAAPEQLKVYGRIMELPTLVASSADELALALDSFGGLDLVLVDTVGRSPGDGQSLAELADLLGEVPRLSCQLVLACPTRDADQNQAISAYARFSPASLIFTKLDETTTYGPILNQVVRTGWPVSYVTFGQRVPEDLEEASRDGLARRLLPPRRQA